MIGGITDVLIGARDLAAWRDLLVGGFGYTEVLTGRDLGPCGAGSLHAATFAAPGVDSGRFRVIEYSRPVDRARPTMRETGPFDIDIYARDIHASHRSLSAKGYSFSTEPLAWEMPGLPITLYQTVLHAPDGVNIAIMASAAPRNVAAFAASDTVPISEVTSAIAVVRDYDQSLAFWRDSLGLSLGLNSEVSHPAFERILGLKTDDRIRLTIYTSGGESARNEVISFPDGQVTERVVSPGSTGHFGWAFRVPDLDLTVSRMVMHGATVLSVPNLVSDAIHGDARVALLRSPDGIVCEIWQPA